jgi:hypothetical protein
MNRYIITKKIGLLEPREEKVLFIMDSCDDEEGIRRELSKLCEPYRILLGEKTAGYEYGTEAFILE